MAEIPCQYCELYKNCNCKDEFVKLINYHYKLKNKNIFRLDCDNFSYKSKQ